MYPRMWYGILECILECGFQASGRAQQRKEVLGMAAKDHF